MIEGTFDHEKSQAIFKIHNKIKEGGAKWKGMGKIRMGLSFKEQAGGILFPLRQCKMSDSKLGIPSLE